MPDTDLNEVVDRLRAELKLIIEREETVIRTITSDPEFAGLTAVGGIQTILRRLHEEQEKVRKLEAELRKHILKA